MNKNVLLGIVIILLISNGLTYSLLHNSESKVNSVLEVANTQNKEENQVKIIATIGDVEITEQEFMQQLEKIHGKEVLYDMIDKEVVFQTAQKNGITISDDEINREITMLKALSQDSIDQIALTSEQQWREEIKYSLLLEEILTKDIVVSESELREYYEYNKDFYEIPTVYHLSHIVLSNKEEAKQVLKELESGSSFSALAMERSIDPFTSMMGGDLGFVSEMSEYTPDSYLDIVKEINEGEWTEPIQTDDGFSILLLQEVIKGRSYSFEEVKDQIRRQIALQEIDDKFSPRVLWSEVGVSLEDKTITD